MKNQWKKLLSVMIAIALVITMVPVQSAQAAAKPKLNTTKKTILVGSKTTLKVKNTVKNAKYTWKSSNKAAVTVNQKGVVTGKAGGESIVSCKVKTPEKTYTLKANIVVKDSAVVATQKELNKALANEGITKIKIKTEASKKFKISEGDYSNKLLIVEAPNADVSNNGGVFKRIAIRSIKPDTWIERANGNKFSISAQESRIVVGKTASVKAISFTKAGAEAKVDVRGNVGKVAVNAAIDLNVVGNAKEVNVEVASTATDVKIVAAVPVNVTAKTDITLELEKGAEGSKVETTDSNIQVEVKNDTEADVVVSTPEGEKTVNAGTTSDGKDTTTDDGTTTDDDATTDDSTTADDSTTTDDNTATGGNSSIGNGGSFGGGVVVVTKYELQSYGSDFTITAAEGLTEDEITVNADNWEIRLNKEVDAGAEIAVNGTSVLVGGKVIATLSDKVAITGTDANGNVVAGTARLTWRVAEQTAEGMYTVVGILGMPFGWVNPHDKGIAVSVVITSLVPDNLYEIEYVGSAEETFVLQPSVNTTLNVVATGGAVTISSEDILDGSLLSIEDGQLKYNGEVVGTLPTTVWVEGPNVKDSSVMWKAAELELSWQSEVRNNGNGSYRAVANLVTNENWINPAGRGAVMTITLKSNTIKISNINIWNEADAAIYAANCLKGEDITAAIATGSAVTVSGAVDVNVDGDNRTTATYTLAGTLPFFTLGGEEGRYVLFSLEKSTVSGIWKEEGVDEDYSIKEGGMYTFSGSNSNRIIVCLNIADIGKFGLYVDVDGDGTFSSGDVRYIINSTNVIDSTNVN